MKINNFSIIHILHYLDVSPKDSYYKIRAMIVYICPNLYIKYLKLEKSAKSPLFLFDGTLFNYNENIQTVKLDLKEKIYNILAI